MVTLGNDANAVYEYDLANRLTKLTNNIDDTNSITFEYSNYDKVGNRLSMKIDDANAYVFNYDNLYQLTFVDYNDSNSTSYSYDSLGNRTDVNDGTPMTYLRNNLNQYTSVGGTNYSYDNNGNLTDDGLFKYYYDCENQLTDVNDQNDTAVASYSYDYLGRRISKTVYGSPDVTTKYCYDGDQVIAEYDGSDNLLRKYVYGPGIDEPICMIDVTDSNAVYYYHLDGLGSVAALSDANADIVESYSYDVFGAPTIYDANETEISQSAIGNPYMFTARRADDETALYYYRARYYAFDIGRFLQTDPIEYLGGLNLYTYCGNNPPNWSDPYGLFGFGIGGSLTGSATPVGATGGGQIVFDFSGNIGVFVHGGGGGSAGGSGGAMLDISAFTGTVKDLSGPFMSYGGSGGEVIGIGGEINLIDQWLYDPGSAMTISFGAHGGLPAEAHAFREIGQVPYTVHVSEFIPPLSYIRDFWKDVWKEMWADNNRNTRNTLDLPDFRIADPKDVNTDLLITGKECK
jgi:RHS repeat-associated protein